MRYGRNAAHFGMRTCARSNQAMCGRRTLVIPSIYTTPERTCHEYQNSRASAALQTVTPDNTVPDTLADASRQQMTFVANTAAI